MQGLSYFRVGETRQLVQFCADLSDRVINQ
jgi:hypothetical protein